MGDFEECAFQLVERIQGDPAQYLYHQCQLESRGTSAKKLDKK